MQAGNYRVEHKGKSELIGKIFQVIKETKKVASARIMWGSQPGPDLKRNPY